METIRFSLIEDIRLLLMEGITPILHTLPDFQVITQAENTIAVYQLKSVINYSQFCFLLEKNCERKQYITEFMITN